jgi:geranylgeranyl diphosphate synthase type II
MITDYMNFKEYIELHRNEVYSKICEYLPIKEPEEHYKIVRDYIDRQGSYRRPGLVMLSGQMYGASVEELLLPAAAMQLSEDWILIQDDIEDDSDLRRGKPALHKLYGWVHALDASDTGHIAMWRMLKDYIVKYGVEKGNRLYEKFYSMLLYTVEGQYLENTFIHYTKDLSQASESLYFKIADSKTCFYTVHVPMQLGAIVGNASDESLNMLKEIGQPAGIAFQITDDILDMTADEKVFGKKRFGDLYEGKITLMILHAYKNATPDEKAKIDSIYKKDRKEKTPEEISFLADIINKYDGIGYAKEMAEKYGEEATRLVEKHLPELPQNEYTDILISAMKEMYTRKK